jgi:hypothetical protein
MGTFAISAKQDQRHENDRGRVLRGNGLVRGRVRDHDGRVRDHDGIRDRADVVALLLFV